MDDTENSNGLNERKFGYVVQPNHHHCHPCPPPPPYPMPIPPGISTQDWIQYINTYIDVRARQIYDKLKKIAPGGGGDGVQSVTYLENEGLADQFEIGNLKVDGASTPIHVPVIGIDAVDRDDFTNPKPILTIEGIGDNGEDVNVYCEDPQIEPFDPDGYVFDEILLKDREHPDKVYKVYIKNGTLESDLNS